MTEPSYVKASKQSILKALDLLCSECGERTRGERATGHALGCSRAEGDTE